LSFDLDIPDHEEAYWDRLPLSSQAKERVRGHVATVSDEFRLDPENRLGPNSPYFKITHIIWDFWGDRRVHAIDFCIRDDRAVAGVLIVVYIEHH
jgi:hypothetical protein